MKKIAAITMLRNDEFFLQKWVEYYAKELGRQNLYIYFDGLDQKVPLFCKGTNYQLVEHIPASVSQGDKHRINFLSTKAKELFKNYDIIIGTDVDEFLVVDPKLNTNLVTFLSSVKTSLPCISGLGVDVGQHLEKEKEITLSENFLSQRSYAKLSTRYSKTNVLLSPCDWGSGFHRVRNSNFHIIKDLYLFHFGCVDLNRIKIKIGDKSLNEEGWSKHLKKRTKTIYWVSKKKVRNFDKTVSKARLIQNIFRPPYAWNKPSMFEQVIIVKIPSRFSSIV